MSSVTNIKNQVLDAPAKREKYTIFSQAVACIAQLEKIVSNLLCYKVPMQCLNAGCPLSGKRSTTSSM